MATSPIQSDIAQSYNSFSGSDIKAQIGPFPFANIQAISYSVTREKAPIYTMGSADPRSYSRNKRGIAGSLVWLNFDRHALLDLFRKAAGKFVADIDDIMPAYATQLPGAPLSPDAIFSASASRASGIPVGATIDQSTTSISAVGQANALAYAWYSDQLIPFDITLSGVNELGAATAMKLHGVEILNEGGGISVDDAVTEMQATFVARLIEPWQAVVSPFAGTNFYGA